MLVKRIVLFKKKLKFNFLFFVWQTWILMTKTDEELIDFGDHVKV